MGVLGNWQFEMYAKPLLNVLKNHNQQ
jgi:hypothetical protein